MQFPHGLNQLQAQIGTRYESTLIDSIACLTVVGQVVLPAVARKKGLDDQYQTTDGSPKPRKPEPERPEPVRSCL